MQEKIITFILPRTGETPIGGFKVVYEYANRLVEDGYTVNIVYGITSRPVKNLIIRYGYYFCRWFRWLKYRISKNYTPEKWFKINKKVNHLLRYRLTQSSIPETSYLFATSWSTAYWVNSYKKISPEKKYYLIQSFEDWDGDKNTVIKTWKMKLNKIVIAPWLADIAQKLNEKWILIENGFDQQKFYITTPIEKKDKYSITMLWHDHPLKACNIGLKAIMLVKQKYPELKARFFGVPSRPQDLPSWIYYTQTPSPTEHLQIYNLSGIFLGPSSKEGFCLTPPEAMLCGCAIVCTDIGGYTVVAKHEQTALLSPVGDYNSLAKNIIRLIEDDALRIKVAYNGLNLIKSYTWNNSYQKLKHALQNPIITD